MNDADNRPAVVGQVEPSVMQHAAMAQVCLDLHESLGVRWGDDPYRAIAELRKDAERYRWLKESENLVWPSVDLANACHRAQQTGSGAPIDAEIDRQMQWPAVGDA